MDITPLSMPPEASFPTFDALYSSIQAHAKLAGYAWVIRKSEQRKGRQLKGLRCKRSSTYRSSVSNEDSRQRQRCTVKTQCPVSAKARERSDGSWDFYHNSLAHNHDAATAGAFPEHRRLTTQQISTVTSHYSSGVIPSRIVTILRDQEPGLSLNHRDVYNVTAVLSRAQRLGMSPPEALVTHLEAEKLAGQLFFEYRRDEDGHIVMLFVADKRSIEYLNQHPDILLLDSTYKTNKFGMPLLDILGVDNMNCSFSVGFCFMDQETQEAYNEAISLLRSLFKPGIYPSVIATDCELALIYAVDQHFSPIQTKRVICFWHVCKNLMAHCKANFGTQERWEEFEKAFAEVVKAKTEDQYYDILEEFKTEFHWNNGNPYTTLPNTTPSQEIIDFDLERQAVGYALGQWLVPHHRHLVHAYIDRHFHWNTTSTSRLEGAHAVLKRWIGGPSNDLTQVWKAIKLAVDDQLNEIYIKKAQQAQAIPVSLSGAFYYQVIGKISHFGLYQLRRQYLQYQLWEQDPGNQTLNTNCTYSFATSMGIPCWHIIRDRVAENQSIYPLYSIVLC